MMTGKHRPTRLPRGVKSLRRKLHPTRFSAMSGQMQAMVAYILNEEWTTPPVHEVIITEENYLIVNGAFFGAFHDWVENLSRLFEAADLNRIERRVFIDLHLQRIESRRPTTEQALRAMLLES